MTLLVSGSQAGNVKFLTPNQVWIVNQGQRLGRGVNMISIHLQVTSAVLQVVICWQKQLPRCHIECLSLQWSSGAAIHGQGEEERRERKALSEFQQPPVAAMTILPPGALPTSPGGSWHYFAQWADVISLISFNWQEIETRDLIYFVPDHHEQQNLRVEANGEASSSLFAN